MLHCLYRIGIEEGLRKGIYKGIEASCMREAIYSSLRLGLYESFKRNTKNSPVKLNIILTNFIAGSMSGLVGSAIANPADLLKTRM